MKEKLKCYRLEKGKVFVSLNVNVKRRDVL